MWLLFASFCVINISSARVPAIHHSFAWMLLGNLFYSRLFAKAFSVALLRLCIRSCSMLHSEQGWNWLTAVSLSQQVKKQKRHSHKSYTVWDNIYIIVMTGYFLLFFASLRMKKQILSLLISLWPKHNFLCCVFLTFYWELRNINTIYRYYCTSFRISICPFQF